jgi:very-short-patch-repair endonuclease
MYGKHFKMSKEHKRKIGEAQIGPKNHNWRGGKIKRICKVCKKSFYVKPSVIKYSGALFCSHHYRGIYTIKHKKTQNTSIEIAMENELKKQYIPYLPQAPIKNIALVDFLLPNKIIVQCDGIYWHNKPNVKQRDKKQDNILTSYGYKIFRFTDIEIEKSPQKCLEKIYGKFLSL